MMFQSYALFPHMTVEQNVGYGLIQDRVPKAEISERVADMLSIVELSPFAIAQTASIVRRSAATRCAGKGTGQKTKSAASR